MPLLPDFALSSSATRRTSLTDLFGFGRSPRQRRVLCQDGGERKRLRTHERSALMNSYVLPSAASLACWRHFSTTSCPSCSFLPMMYTLAPAWAKRIPTAAPMPWAVDDPQRE
jgi:hypothetical protein